jgi:hypothetical protein
MKRKASRLSVVVRAFVWFAIVSGVCLSRAATPNSPEVRAMLDRARAYLQTASRGGPHSGQLGGQALIGLAAYKYEKRFGQGETVIPELTQAALNRIITVSRDAGVLKSIDNYSLGIALVFLTEVRPTEHTSEISVFLDELLSRQKRNGAWGYSYDQVGDTSQLQYAALGIWSAKAAGCGVPDEVVVNLMNYVLRVQDPSGGWGYKGNDPGTFMRVAQTPVRPSLAAAGLGSLYVLADIMGLSHAGAPRKATKVKIPAALRPVVAEQNQPGRRGPAANVEVSRLKQAMSDGNAWFRQLPTLQTEVWQFYFLYAYERYNSFRELVEGTYEAEPPWYNNGVRLLQGLQAGNGQWGSDVGLVTAILDSDPPVSTAFAMLFLLRSTRETIEKVVERDGILRGGYDLPSDLSEVRLKDNRLVAPAIVGEVADMIGMLENNEGDKIESLLDNPDSLSLSGLTGEGREFTARLARVLRTGSYQARIVAARTLGRQGELDNVPVLIYALSDGDPRVVKEAQAGLRLTSRRFDGIELPDNPKPADIDALVAQWKTWYKAVRPDAVFIE